MLVVIGFIIWIIATIIGAIKLGGVSDIHDALNGAGVLMIFLIIFVVIFGVIAMDSYGNTVGMHKTYYGTLEQHRDAIEIYGDKAVVTIDNSMTDFKYQGYQDNMASFIKDLRKEITTYNKTLVGKRFLKKNIIIGWLINYDKNLPLLELKEKE